MEAKYFFADLYKVKPNHSITLCIGYEISIHTFDNEGVGKFDLQLYDSGFSRIELAVYRLKYYHSVNDHKNCEDTCKLLLSEQLTQTQLSTIVDVCFTNENYAIADNLIKYFKKNRLEFTAHGVKRIKKILLQKFVDSIVGSKHG